jgi:hypothetical protein
VIQTLEYFTYIQNIFCRQILRWQIQQNAQTDYNNLVERIFQQIDDGVHYADVFHTG